ncbi:7355_t:CDS:1, partial [Paraglomus occultum]
DEILQNMSDESDHIDAPMDDVISEAVESDLDEYEEASFDDAFNDLHHPQTIEWPNDAYHDFMELINIYQLSNSA